MQLVVTTVTVTAYELQVWDTRTKGAQQTFFLGLPLTALDMAKDGTDVFVGSIDPNIHVE